MAAKDKYKVLHSHTPVVRTIFQSNNNIALLNITSMYKWASLVAQTVKTLPAMWETWVRSLGWKDPRGRERLPTPVFWPGEFHRLYIPWGRKESDTTERLSLMHIKK